MTYYIKNRFIHAHTFEKQVCPAYFTKNIQELNDYISLLYITLSTSVLVNSWSNKPKENYGTPV